MQAVTEEIRKLETVTAADDFKINYGTAARDALFNQSPAGVDDEGDRTKGEARTRE